MILKINLQLLRIGTYCRCLQIKKNAFLLIYKNAILHFYSILLAQLVLQFSTLFQVIQQQYAETSVIHNSNSRFAPLIKQFYVSKRSDRDLFMTHATGRYNRPGKNAALLLRKKHYLTKYTEHLACTLYGVVV